MPRPSKGVTLANMIYVQNYFRRALKENRLYQEDDNGWHLNYKANQAFEEMVRINCNKKISREEEVVFLQGWIDQYVSAKKWQRCLMTLRQKRSRKKHDLRKVELPIDVYLTVKNLAEKMNCAMWEAIDNVAQQALKKVYRDMAKDDLL